MTMSIENILRELGETITSQLTAANDRALSAEKDSSQLRSGLLALVGGLDCVQPPAREIAQTSPPKDENTRVSANATSRRRTSVSDQSFLDVLNADWQTAHTILGALGSLGIKVAYGTVYSRLKKLVEAYPDVIENADAPARWRLRGPHTNDCEAKVTKPAKSHNVKKLGKQRVPQLVAANDMPPKAITYVRERIAGLPAPQRTFRPNLIHGDCFNAMREIDSGSVDLILTDPPYAMTRLDIDPEIDLNLLWAEYRRIIKATGTIVVFGSRPFSAKVISAAYDLFKHDLIWIKNGATHSLNARNRPLKQHEDILVFSTGTTIHADRSSRRYTYNALGQVEAGQKKISAGKSSGYLKNVIHDLGRVYESTGNNPRTTLFCSKDRDNCHPFQKPLDLLEYLIRTYSNEGDTVLDTFAGSGSTCVAAMRSGRRSIGIEMSDKHFENAKKRVESLMVPLAKAA